MEPQTKSPAQKSVGQSFPRSLFDLQREVDRVFDAFSGKWDLPDLFGKSEIANFNPQMEVHETATEITVSAELPGMEEKDISVQVLKERLTISGEKKLKTEIKEGDLHRSERHYGSFSRTMSLPFDAADGNVDASYKNGVLTVRVAKPKEAIAKTRKIAIKADKR